MTDVLVIGAGPAGVLAALAVKVAHELGLAIGWQAARRHKQFSEC
jgi:2-polyprenyl-6-methoxyphenol hydroxylase-like FAD-dependent oxidoreductase